MNSTTVKSSLQYHFSITKTPHTQRVSVKNKSHKPVENIH